MKILQTILNWNYWEKYLWVTMLFWGFIYSIISLVNHYNFRTYGFDLGIFINEIYDYQHGHWNDPTLYYKSIYVSNLLADHFSITSLFITPIANVLGSYTLLVIQIIAILLGGYGIYKYVFYKSNNKATAHLFTFHFFCIWGVFSAVSYDFHYNVIGTMCVPYIFLYLEQKKWLKFTLFAFLLITSKENMALWGAFIGLGLAWLHYKDKSIRSASLFFAFVSIAHFLFVLKIFVPMFAERYNHFKYALLGNTMGETIKTMVLQPIIPLKGLFFNHLPNTIGNNIKMESNIVFLLSGGILLFWRPQYLFMLLPIFTQKYFNNDVIKWGTKYQYCIEFLPIIALGSYTVYEHWLISKKRYSTYIPISLLLTTSICTIKITQSPISVYHDRAITTFWSPTHYATDYKNVAAIHTALNSIPIEAVVSADNCFVPHVAYRDTVYLFPDVRRETDYIAIKNDTTPDLWPNKDNPALTKKWIKELQNTAIYTPVLVNEDVIIVKKK